MPTSLTFRWLLVLLGLCCGSARACSNDAYYSSICVAPYNQNAGLKFRFNGWIVAAGQSFTISQNPAMYSLLGITYGSSDQGKTQFAVPDLRGRMVIGASSGAPSPSGALEIGATGGAASLILNSRQLASHAHGMNSGGANAPVINADTSQMKGSMAVTLPVSISLSGLQATASLASQSFTASTGNLVLQGASGGTLTSNPASAALATISAPVHYSTAAPTTQMVSGSISGNLSGQLGGTAALTLAGTPAVNVQGTGAVSLPQTPSPLAVSGYTAPAGGGAPIVTLPSYTAMTYYILFYDGYYPSRQ